MSIKLKAALRMMALVLVALAVVSGCGNNKEDDVDMKQRVEERAVQTRANVDDLVRRLGGAGVTVTGDDTIECDLTNPDGGLVHSYGVRFTVNDGAVQRLQGEIADALAGDGWTVRRDPRNEERGVDSVRFLKDPFAFGAKISDSGKATAFGSGGCVQ